MNNDFPAAVPEIPVSDMAPALTYYQHQLGFAVDWGDEASGIVGISQGSCRIFLANGEFRERRYHNAPPALIWLNLSSRAEVDDLHERWRRAGARIVSPPDSKPWKLHEFTAADLDGNLFRVFYDFAWETRGD